MQFPFTEVRPGVFRPKVIALLWGSSGPLLLDGLLDTGADRTLIPLQAATSLGIDVATLGPDVGVQSGTGQTLPCKTTHILMELRQVPTRLCWLAEVAIPTQHIGSPYWGFKGFLEFFKAEFDGANRLITLQPGASLPVVTPP